jgi:cell division protein FtsI (penicillin-binding protein 3)
VAGIELAYDSWLAGHTGRKQYIKDLHGEAVRDIGVVDPARPGRGLQLSIDLRLQTAQHRELQRASAGHRRRGRHIVTLDAHSGEVLAWRATPFNPNNRSGVSMEHTRSRAMTDVFEPGIDHEAPDAGGGPGERPVPGRTR